MTQDILSQRELEIHIASWQLIPSSGGLFEFVVDGDTLYSKKASGRHAEPGEIEALFKAKLAALGADV